MKFKLLSFITAVIDKFKIVFFFLLFSYIFMFSFSSLFGTDYFFHLKAGEYITTTKSIPKHDVFSFTQKGKKWINHEWLYQVIIYNFYKMFGEERLVYFKAFIFALSFVLLTFVVFRISWMPAIILIFFSLQISVPRFILRPDTVSFLFTVFYLTTLFFRKRWMLFLLPFIQILWTNIHGFFPLGPFILGLYILFHLKEKDKFHRQLRAVFLAVLIVCFISPYPMEGIRYPFNVIEGIIKGNLRNIYANIKELSSPWTNIDFSNPYIFFVVITGLMFSAFKRFNFYYFFLWIFFLLFSANSLRNTYFIIPIGIIVFVDRYPYIKEIFINKVFKDFGYLFFKILTFVIMVIIAKDITTNLLATTKRVEVYFDSNHKMHIAPRFFSRLKSTYPQGIIDFIKSTPLPQRMYNDFNTGAILIFNFFPQRKVFIDGRAEFYGKDFFSEYLKIFKGDEKAIKEAINKYRLDGFIIDYVYYDPTSIIKIVYELGYKCVYFGKDGIIFVQPDYIEKNNLQDKIVGFLKVKWDPDLIQEIRLFRPSIDGFYRMAYVLYELKFYDNSKDYLRGMLDIDPFYWRGYYLLSKIYYAEGKYHKAFINCRKTLLINPNFREAKELLGSIYLKLGYKKLGGRILRQIGEKYNNNLNDAQ